MIVDPRDPQSVVDHLYRVQRVVDGDVEFGHPQDPADPQSTTLADGATHNGTLLNIRGSWVEVEVAALDTAVTFTHNLAQPIVSASVPNVRWLHFLYEHDGTGVTDGTAVVSCNYETGDTVGENAIALRFYAAGGRTVDGDHPLRATLFFVGAVR